MLPYRHVAIAIIGFLLTAALSAHPMSHSIAVVGIEGRDVQLTLTIDLLELGGVDRNSDELITDDELNDAIESVYARLKSHLVVEAGGVADRVTLDRYEIVEDRHIARLTMAYRFGHEVSSVTVVSTLDEVMKPDHRLLVTANAAGSVQEAVLDLTRPRVEFSPSLQSWSSVARTFLLLGVEHIFTGYDHLAFLVCLLMGLSSLRDGVLVITSFTVAHSITLALATLGLVELPSRLIETVIAASIAWVAIENALAKRMVRRYAITFLFGLIHGFGFANVLRDMQLPRGSLALSLVTFNAGVEAGQLAFVLVLGPLVMRLSKTASGPYVRSAVSMAVVALALFWLVQRAFAL